MARPSRSTPPCGADLNDVNARRAAELGALIAVDARTPIGSAELDNIDARCRDGATRMARAGRVINTWPTAKLLDWARPRRIGRAAREARTGANA